MKYIKTFSADATTQYVCDVRKPEALTEWMASVLVYGAFGSGTITMFVSPDNGTTFIPLLNTNNTAISVATAAAMNTVRLGDGGHLDDALKIYATLAGSTAPALTVAVFDNR